MVEPSDHSPLSVLMTTDTVGGVWSYSLELCRAMLPYNLRFHLVTTGAPMQTAQRNEVEALQNVTVYETDFMLEWMDAPWKSIDASAAWLLELASKLQPDLIHLNGFVYGSLPWNAPALVVAHSDVWSWWLSVKKACPPAEWNEYFNRVQAGLQKASFVVAPSKTMMADMRNIYGVTTPGNVIYNGRSADIFCPGEKSSFVFSMGRMWDEAKNVQLVVDAAPLIPYDIHLAGYNSFEGSSCAIEGTNIAYLGKLSIDQVAKELAAAAVYVHPAKYEPFGLSVLEAALSGCALVLGDIDSLREIWQDSAIYVDTDDRHALAETVNELMRNERLRLQHAGNAMRQAMKYTTSEMTKNYLETYRQMLQVNMHKKELL